MLVADLARPALPGLDITMLLMRASRVPLTEIAQVYEYDGGWDAARSAFEGLAADLVRDEAVRDVLVCLRADGREDLLFEAARPDGRSALDQRSRQRGCCALDDGGVCAKVVALAAEAKLL